MKGSDSSEPASHGEFAAAAALFCLYLAVAPGHYQSVDGMLMFEQARALLYDGSLFFREPFVWDDTFNTSLYGIGQSLAYLPTLALSSAFEAQVFRDVDAGIDLRRIYLDVVYALSATPTQAFLTAFAAHRLAKLIREIGFDRRTSLWALAFFGVGSPALVYAGSDFAQPLTAACIVYSIERGLAFQRSQARAALFACAIAIAYALLTRPLEAGLLLPFAFVACTGSPNRRMVFGEMQPIAIALGCAFMIGVGISLAVNAARYGSPFHNEYAALGASFVWPGTGVLGLLFSPARGLAWNFPALWLVPLGLRVLWRTRELRSGALALGGFSLSLLGVTGSWHSWFGGVCWGPRFMVSALPLLAALAAIGASGIDPRARRVVSWTLLILGAACGAPGVMTDLFAGYGAKIASTPGSFDIANYPPLAAWRFTTHLFANTPLDRHAIDVVWFRMARQTGSLSLLPFAGLLALATWLALRVTASLREGRP